MAQTYKRTCLKDYKVTDQKGNTLELKKGKVYVTGPMRHGRTIVFSTYWIPVPVDIFGAAEKWSS